MDTAEKFKVELDKIEDLLQKLTRVRQAII